MSTPSAEDHPHLGSVARGTAVSISTEIMVAAIIFFFLVVVFVFFLHIYARMRWRRLASSASRRSRLVFAAGQDPAAAPRRGLDPSVVDSLPVCVYRDADFKAAGGLECAVCLSELAEGEKARILPGCSHGFHLECIDMWFHSHSTCPLCRRPVGPEAGAGGEATPPPEEEDEGEGLTADLTGSPNLPTNVLFWGTQDRVSTVAGPHQQEEDAPAASATSSSSPGKLDGALVIEIPCRAPAGWGKSSPHSPLPPSKFPTEDMKSPATATTTPTRLRTLRRILSREKRVAGGPFCSTPRGGAGDIEQGMGGTDGGCGGSGGVAPPRTPTGSGKN